MKVGIEKVHAYPCALGLDLELLGKARGRDTGDLRDNLLVISRGVNPLWEDAVTTAVNAALPMLSDDDKQNIELLIVATESGIDQGKPISTYAQRFLQIQPNCRNFEAKHGCYSGTSATMMAAHWVSAPHNKGKKALVIASDQARLNIGEDYEYVMGACAVAVLVSDNPRVLEIELAKNGYWTNEVSDTFRPTLKVETGNSDESLYCYIDALEGAYAHYLTKAGDVNFDEEFKKNIYHIPFGGITFQAHRTLLRTLGRRTKSQAWEHFTNKVKPGLHYASQIGGSYSASTFLALMGLVDQCDDLKPGDRLGIFSYGSGSCGEFYSGIVGPDAKEIVSKANLGGLIAERYPLSVEEYETVETARHALIAQGNYAIPTEGYQDLYQRRFVGKKRLVYKGIDNYYRMYGWA